MPDGSARRRRAALLTAVFVLAACRGTESKDDAARKAATQKAIAELKARMRAEAARRAQAPPVEPPSGSAAPAEDEESPPPVASGDEPAGAPRAPSPNDLVIVDESVSVGPPGPASATPLGVVLFTRDAELAVAPLGKLAAGKTPVRTPVRHLPAGSGPFALGFGPSLFQDGAYWISQGRLVRRRLREREEPGRLEVLATDALDGARVAVPLPKPGASAARIPATAAYIQKPAKEGAPLAAVLWVEGAPSEGLTAEGNGAHSVSLVRTDDGVVALSVQARMAITPVHARRIALASGRPLLGEDLVVWVGGGITPLTEMTVLPGAGRDLWGFVPHERTMREFGLARLDITTAPTMDTKVTWLVYPNGIDPAPVAAAYFCDTPVVIYAAPKTKKPNSSQELLLRTAVGGEPPLVVAEARVFYFASVAPLTGGALLVWVTDAATHAATLRCARPRK